MSVEQIVKGIIETQMLNLAERIEGDLKLKSHRIQSRGLRSVLSISKREAQTTSS